jgi:hypothetical protein
MTLLTVAALRAQVQTGLDDTQLAALIEREEAEVIARYGADYVDGVTPISETPQGGMSNLYLKRRIGSIVSIDEALVLGGSASTLAASQYHVWADQGRITRLPEGTRWGCSVVASYVPQDDRPLRLQVLIELCRLALEQTAMKSESVAGEYAFQAPDWELARKRLYRRLEFPSI